MEESERKSKVGEGWWEAGERLVESIFKAQTFEGERKGVGSGWLNAWPSASSVIEGGRTSIDLLNFSDKWRCMREGGRESTIWSKEVAKLRCVTEGGSEFTG